MTLVQLFWSKVLISGLEDCWEWTGCKGHKGHGAFGAAKYYGLPGTAHRFSYFILKGPPQESFVIAAITPAVLIRPTYMMEPHNPTWMIK